MTNRLQQRISTIRLGAASAALTLAVVLALGTVATKSAHAQTFTVLHSFTGSPDGAYPYAGPVEDAAGNLYGTTPWGGASYFGVVFEVDTSGTETVLYNFDGATAGANPEAGLVRDEAGNLYGTTALGGAFTYGVVFKLDTSGKEKVLHSFSADFTDGQNPYGDGLIRDKNGNLYGTTYYGGRQQVGTVFKVDTSRKEKVLHVFAGGVSDGAYPYAGVILDAKGNLYGDAEEGGTSDSGVVYKLSKSGKLTVLHSFTGGTNDGSYPQGNLAMDNDGNLYGATYNGGADNAGTVFELSPNGNGGWNETVLHVFAGGASDGAYPYAGVILDANGNLYGTTEEGGASNLGTVYELSGKTITLLHSFDGSDGEYPVGGVIQDTSGNLYGTAEAGGSSGYGTVWQYNPN
jgi:uncharacterized repeat protein (TIGR03803 family)